MTGLSENSIFRQNYQSNFSNVEGSCEQILDPTRKAACEKARDQAIIRQMQGGSTVESFVTNNQNTLAFGTNLLGTVFNMAQASKTGSQVQLGQQFPVQPQPDPNVGGITPEQNQAYVQQQQEEVARQEQARLQSEQDAKQKQFILFGGIGVGVLLLIVVAMVMTGKKGK